MRKAYLFMVLLAAVPMLNAQENTQVPNTGDVFILGSPSGSSYDNIDFPRKNIIIKRGAIPNFKALIGKKLIVTHIETDKNGDAQAVLKRKDGLNFFRFYPTVRAEVSQALQNGELLL